jgi:hypothetical protein
MGRNITFTPIAFEEFRESILSGGLPGDYCYMYSNIANGRRAYITDDVGRVLGRKPRRFPEYARNSASSGAWDV